jgi:FtsZ-binding cell division protein ZapB
MGPRAREWRYDALEAARIAARSHKGADDVITEERIEQLAYEFVNDSDGTLGALQNALRNAAEESDRAARQECAETVSENDICNQLLDHWAEQNKPHLDDEDKCCYVLAVRAVNEIRRLRAEVDALRSENWSLKCEVAGQLGERQALLQRTEEAEADAERYRWLTEDHDSKEMRNRCLEILSRMPVISYSAACAAIDAARKGE